MSDRINRVLKREEVLVRRLPPMATSERSRAVEELTTAIEEPAASHASEVRDEPGPTPTSVDKEELERERQKAWQEGFREGYEQANADLMPIAHSLREALRRVTDERQEIVRGAELIVVRLAYEVARKIVGHEVQISSDAILYIVREALRRIADRDRIVLRLNPQDARVIRKNEELQREVFEEFSSVEIQEDEDISRGGCIVETTSGLIDATIETQLSEIEAALFGED